MQSRPFDRQGSLETTFHWDEGEESFVLSRTQDVEAVLNANKALANERISGFSSAKQSFLKLGEIPLIIIEQWIKEDGVNVLAQPKKEMSDYLHRKLADPQYTFLRTAPHRFYKSGAATRTYFSGTTLAPTAGDILRRARTA